MCEARRSDKAPSEREDASSTAVQPGSPCDAHGTIQMQTPQTRSRTKRYHQEPPYLSSHREPSNEWLPDLSIDQNMPLTPTSGVKRSLGDIIADDKPPKPDKLTRNLDDMLKEAKVTKRRKLEIRAPKLKKSNGAAETAVQAAVSGDRHGTMQQQQQQQPAGREMNTQAVPHPRQARNP